MKAQYAPLSGGPTETRRGAVRQTARRPRAGKRGLQFPGHRHEIADTDDAIVSGHAHESDGAAVGIVHIQPLKAARSVSRSHSAGYERQKRSSAGKSGSLQLPMALPARSAYAYYTTLRPERKKKPPAHFVPEVGKTFFD